MDLGLVHLHRLLFFLLTLLNKPCMINNNLQPIFTLSSIFYSSVCIIFQYHILEALEEALGILHLNRIWTDLKNWRRFEQSTQIPQKSL